MEEKHENARYGGDRDGDLQVLLIPSSCGILPRSGSACLVVAMSSITCTPSQNRVIRGVGRTAWRTVY